VARHHWGISIVVPILAGLLLGLIVGRWWVLVVAAGAGVWVALTEEVEVDGAWLGFAYGVASAVGILIGVLLRRFANRSANPS